LQQISWPGIAQPLAQGRILFTPLGSLLMTGQGTSLPQGLPATILLSIAAVTCFLQQFLSHQAAPRISSLWPLRWQCFWLLSFPAQGEKDRAKGSDTFPSPLPGSARAVEMKHGVQVDDTTSKREPASQPAVPVPGRDPMKVCVARARTVVSPSFRGRRSCGCHPPPLTRRAPSPAYGA